MDDKTQKMVQNLLMTEEIKERMLNLHNRLKSASEAYYAKDEELMSNYEYDSLYDELCMLEQKTGIVLPGSPTVTVGYEAVEELPKERHESPMLSLDKTKDREALQSFLSGKEGVLSWKLDGLTIVLTYENGELKKAVTRGNGEIGEVVTNNAKVFTNVPLRILHKGLLILRGEAVISYHDFEQINASIPETEAKYKNPRNLCSGSVRQLNNRVTASRKVSFYAFTLVKAEGAVIGNSRMEQFEFLQNQGFSVVEHYLVTESSILDRVAYYEKKVAENEIPSDGLVLIYEDIEYGFSLGRTAKFPRDAIAFKWKDEIRETTLNRVEWSASRTGLINPVAVFAPVELEGTTVSRASVHNVSILKSMKLGVHDRITVFKANMIIPQIAQNLTQSGTVMIPEQCPVCMMPTVIKDVNGVESLYCMNPDCLAKKIKQLSHFVSRDALNIEGLSEATLEKLVDCGVIQKVEDIFHLDDHYTQIKNMEGFGEKSAKNLLLSVEKSRETSLPGFVYGLGILNIGLSNAKVLCREFHYDFDKMRQQTTETLSLIPGIGEVIAGSFCSFFANEKNNSMVNALLREVTFRTPEIVNEQKLQGITVVITGSLNHFKDRSAMKEQIESFGGKVTGSVSEKTSMLINNDVNSASSKNKKAKELNVPIVSEEEFMKQFF